MIALVNRSEGWIFVPLPRAGSASFTSVLSDACGTDVARVSFSRPEQVIAYCRENDLSAILPAKNPYTRAVSLFKQTRCSFGVSSFAAFADSNLFHRSETFRPVSYFAGLLEERDIRVRVLRVEKMREDLLSVLGIEVGRIVVLNPSSTMPCENWYDERTRLRVYEWGKRDFEAFGYDVELALAE
jgi:hypothetical protein